VETSSDGKHCDSQGLLGDAQLKANRLIHEKSPYLLQHAFNPVDWFPWGDEAFEVAKEQDKPIFLSIGYSTCHWCHVMAHESFEDATAAKLMNETFVSIKVDREERPDIDHVYMTVCQMMTGGGGWPLNVIMTPEKRPFFAGTYFPKESQHGRIGMVDLTRRIHELWHLNRQEIFQSADKIMTALRQIPDESPGDSIGEETLETAFQQLSQRYDERNGGFSAAPKFPTPHNMSFLLRYWNRSGNPRALQMVEKTLQAMRLGGIYDHLGHGFHRYSTDNEWVVPHFEKMLYDQALLALAYIEAFQATSNPDYEATAREIFNYVLREMTHTQGGFFSAQDADSEGEEGKFYLWGLEEVGQVLDRQENDLVRSAFRLNSEGNFREEASGTKLGTNILYLTQPLSEVAHRLGLPEERLKDSMEQARLKLFNARAKRVPPGKDDKILTDWNGLMISAFARGSQVFNDQLYAQTARRAADFLLETMHSSEGKLLHRFRDGQAGLPAHVDDYAFFINGLLDLYETIFDTYYLKSAIDLNQEFMERFWDDQVGGFYFTAVDGEKLIVRKKEIYDGATPSGNSIAALNLIRLARITANPKLEAMAQRLVTVFSGNVRQFPSAYTQLLSAVDFLIGPSYEVVISGHIEAEDTALMLRTLRDQFIPNKVVVFRHEGETNSEIYRAAPYTRNQQAIDNKATAYVCVNYECSLPTTSPKEMLKLFNLR
jgi:uncharacterized protein